MGIGGEYAAINSAIDESIPARYRGRIDIAVNGGYWLGAVIGTLGALFLMGAAIMIAGGLVEVWLGIDAEHKSLEDIARPVSSAGRR